ncbi:FHA domain-containing protein [Allonocardiopsis opalescens]|uniref:FHA domain-containing protein n=1 Tax=Allonocardiopsis opalescens TaxID=1144618 RepID=A0A2T0QCM0_9ACTN|nr:FHA domain-containing protein [Allonocardiopsis opalescens]PRY01621.1 FHA domain-containing protein [Allonocardiopsis opalescens]
MICPACGARYPVGTPVCRRDFQVLRPDVPPAEPWAARGANATVAYPVRPLRAAEPAGRPPEPVAAGTGHMLCSDPDCGAAYIGSGDVCPYCGSPVSRLTPEPAPHAAPSAPPGRSGLQFPWGMLVVDREPVRIGRESADRALVRELDRYDNVSRQHAVVWRDGARLWVSDMDSSNGTFVNGRRLAAGIPRELNAGDIVRFAADLSAVVVGGPPGGGAGPGLPEGPFDGGRRGDGGRFG